MVIIIAITTNSSSFHHRNMADAFVVDLASGLVLKLVSLATEPVIQAWNLNEDLETLRQRLKTIDALVSDADTKKLTISAVQNWLNKFEAVARVVDVFVDELAYEVIRQKVENQPKVLDFLIPSKNSIIYRLKVAHKIKSIHASFDKIFIWAADLGLRSVAQLSSIVHPREILTTPPFEDRSLIVGRDKDISYLVKTVCRNHEEYLQFIALEGMRGQGKTTLARMIYDSDDVVGMFPKRICVTVSAKFDFMEILSQMALSLSPKSNVLEYPSELIKNIKRLLNGKRFLLVLDDVWIEKPEEWDNLRNSLLEIGGVKGNNIIVTTSRKEVIYAMQHIVYVSYPVEKLSVEDSLTLFKQIAFSDGGIFETKAFAALGRKMVERCGGLPLAIKTLAGLLRSKKSEPEWLLVENNEIWKSKGVLSSLRLSYDNLPYSSLKRCFAYCSIMPKDSHIYKDELVQIWMGLGFLLPPRDSNVLMEDIGNEYFNILLWNSLLQDIERDEYGNITGCRMHDLVHDLALDLSKHHSVTVKPGHELNHISEAIYLRLDEGVSDIKPIILKRNFERVQILYAGTHILCDALPYLNNLTGLVLLKQNYKGELPSSLSNIKYLKYLDISSFGLSNRLLNDITRLYNLQTLRVRLVQDLPKNFCNLINLRHLFIKKTYANTRCLFIGIERLTCLQTLPQFVVSSDQNCLIGQLGGLKNLRGAIELYGLNDIENMEEASKASLCTKSNIEQLTLDWRNNEDEREDTEYHDEDVMEGLKPHANLKELNILYFKGKKFASWITMMKNLMKITLRHCNRCEGFPPLGHLSKLREVEINKMDNVKVIGSGIYGGLGSGNSELSGSGVAKTVTTGYPSLTKLGLYNMPKLEEWVEAVMSTGGGNQCTVQLFPKLEFLRIKDCSKLTRIPSSCFPSLKKLEITNLGSSMILETMSIKVSSLTDIELWNISDGGGGSSSSSNMDSIINEFLKNNSMHLTNLNLSDCRGLTCLTLGVALEKLGVWNCPYLTSINIVEDSGGLNERETAGCPTLSGWVFAQSVRSVSLGPFSEELDEFPWPLSSSSTSVISFPNLTYLELNGWAKLKSILPAVLLDDCLSSTFPALTEMYIFNFQGVRALPDSLAKLPSLEKLHIGYCENLGCLPTFGESNSLQLLFIYDCPILRERYWRGNGTEWHKIQHIPHVYWR